MESNKIVTQGHTERLKIKEGIDIAANAVRPTLGPIGMMAVIEYPGLDPIECDDGVTILKNINLKDHYQNIGVKRLRKGALRTFEKGGDATATTTVLSQAFVNEAFKEAGSDSSKILEIRNRFIQGRDEVIESLKAMKRNVLEHEIERIAQISSLDNDAAKHIAEVIKEVGVKGIVTVQRGNKLGYSHEVVKGARFNKGLISEFFINDPDTESTILKDVYVILVDRVISMNEQIIPLLNSIGTGKDILFIADDVNSVALATLTQNARLRVANIACVKNPYTGLRGKEFLFDIASLTGATVISEETGMRLDTATIALCGKADKVEVTKNMTTIIGGISSDKLQERIKTIESKIDESISEYERLQLDERLASLTGGIGVIRFGSYTDTEFAAKKHKLDNAINTTQSSLEEGIIPGGGSALAHVNISDPIFKNALREPLKQMAINSGMDWPSVVTDVISGSPEIGFDFISKKKVNMFDVGIIDAFKTTRLAIESAIDTACSVVSYETVIIIDDEKE